MRFPSMFSASATLAALCSLLLLNGACGQGTSNDSGNASPVSAGGELGNAPASATQGDGTPGDDAPGPKDDSTGKIIICHVPPGNPANAHTLTVSVNGWNGHQHHKGDYVGACRGSEGGPDAGTTGGDEGGGSTDAGSSTPDAGVPACIPEGDTCGGDGQTCCTGLECDPTGICRSPVVIN